MDKEFEKKVRMKRIRAAAVAIIVIAIAAYLIYDMDVEKADYGDSLQEQITAAQSLYDEQKEMKRDSMLHIHCLPLRSR